MGLSLDRSLAIKEKLSSRLLDIYSGAIYFKMAHEQILQRKNERIFDTPEYKKVPEWVRSYLDGMDRVKLNNLYAYHLVWMISVDGKLLTSQEVKDLAKQEADCYDPRNADPFIAQQKNYQSPWGRVNTALSHYCWKDDDGQPLRNKPFQDNGRKNG